MLRSVPLDKTYEHTLYFNRQNTITGRQDQYDYFNSFASSARTYNSLSYVRKEKGIIRIKDNAVNLLDCNYMMYQNTAYDPYTWFYAFVTKVEYVNDGTTEVEFEIDVMQTWYWNFEPGYCFVEREHVFDDSIGANTIPENLELGEYMYQDTGTMTEFTQNWSIVIAATFRGTYDQTTSSFVWVDSTGGIYGGLYSGLWFNVFSSDNYEMANQFLSQAADDNKSEGIVSVFMIPSLFVRGYSTGNSYSALKTILKDYSWTYNLGDYPARGPRNNKLYTYPYNLLYVTDQQGHSAEYRYEFFLWSTLGSADRCQFSLEALMSCNPECQLVPLYYNQDTNEPSNYNERLTLNGFPQCAYAIDAYKAWLAQQGGVAGLALDYGGAIFNGAMSTMGALTRPGGPDAIGVVSGVGNTLLNVGNLVREQSVASARPPMANGQSSMGLGVATKTIGFRIYKCHVRPEYAKIIDDYFDKYGYAVHQNKIPVLKNRDRWTFVKTVGFEFSLCNMPSDDAAKIASIFDKGITFWAYKGSASATHVGDYSDTNYPNRT